ncbi:hypothetical protein Tco_0738890, partial [Tanacetum coccineum]
IMGEPLSPDRVFDFLMDEPEPQHAYDFFAPGSLPGYVGNPNNTNGWIKADVPLLRELGEPLGAEVDEPLVDPVIDELEEPIVEVEEQMVAPMMDIEEDLAMLFGVRDDSSDDDFEGPEGDEEVWEMDEEWLMAPVIPPPMPVMPPPSTYEVGGSSIAATEGHYLTLLTPGVPVPPSVIEDLCTRMGNLEYGHGLLVKKVMTVSDAEVMASQMVQAVSRLEQVGVHVEQGQQAATQRDATIAGLSQQVQTLQAAVQHRDVQIQQLQTLVAEMSSREGTLM